MTYMIVADSGQQSYEYIIVDDAQKPHLVICIPDVL